MTDQLDVQWARLRRARGSIEQARGWGIDLPEGASLTDLQQIVDATHRSERAADRRLAGLVDHARNDELAGTVVLRRILPALIRDARRQVPVHSARDGVDTAIATAWDSIARYDTDRRPHSIAAALVSDTIHRAFRGPRRRRSADELVVAPLTLVELSIDDLADRTALDELLDVLDEARSAGVPRGDVEFVRRYAEVGSPGRLAREQGVTTRTIWNRRDRAVRRIREAVVLGEAA